jgi:hypothetical protein
MSFDPLSLFVGIIFGSIAGGILIYGWRQKKPVHLVFGVALTVLIYMIDSPLAATLVSIATLVAWWAAMKYFRD